MLTRRPSGVRVAAAAATILLFAALDPAVAQAGTTPTCFGEAATIVGSRGETRVHGTAGRDVIFSRWDDQFIHGHGGDDLLCGHSSIYGGRGDDRMIVRSEKAFLDGSSLYGGPGNDTIHRGEAVADDPHFALDTHGGPGQDRLYGGPNLDELRGGAGRDRIFGFGMRDVIAGGRGPDFLVGGRAGDYLRGGRGSDMARGGPGDDRIVAGAGADVARGGAGIDTCLQAEDVHCELP